MRALLASALLFTVLTPVAHAGKKAEQKAYVKAFMTELEATYSGQVWALRDLPVKSGLTMGVPWIGPIAEVTSSGYKIEATGGMDTYMAGASGVWFSVRPYETLQLKEAEFDDGEWVIVFEGVGDSDGRDTKIKVTEQLTFAQLKPVLDELVSTTDPLVTYDDWSPEVKTAIRRRVLINGMSKRQAYLVVGEPTGAEVREDDGKKIETWTPRQNDGIRIGYAGGVTMTGYPASIRFEDGELVGIATTVSGGVSLD